MPRRIEINENIELRELTREENGAQVATGEFGIFSLDKKEFIKLDGETIKLQNDDILVLPAQHALQKLDLTLKDKDGKAASKDMLVTVENQGNRVTLDGKTLAVRGNVAIETTQYQLAGINESDLTTKKDLNAFSEHAPNADLLPDPNLKTPLPPGLTGRTFHYGDNKTIIALSGIYQGCVNCLDANSDPKSPQRLLTIDGDTNATHRGKARQQIEHMQTGVELRLHDALAKNDKQALIKLGVPQAVADKLEAGEYTISGNAVTAQAASEWYKTWLKTEEEEEKVRERNQKKPMELPGAAKPEGRVEAPAENKEDPLAGLNPDYSMRIADIQSRRPMLENFNTVQALQMEEKQIIDGTRIAEADFNNVKRPEGPGSFVKEILGRAFS